MANSRLEKIGNIYTRAKGLIQSGALQWEDRPLWYDLFERFPPKEDPRFDRPAPQITLKQIFYEEDNIRSIFHKRNKQIGITNMFNSSSQTVTQRFIQCFQKLQKEYETSVPVEKVYEEAVEMLQKERQKKSQLSEEEGEAISLTKSFKDAQEQRNSQEPMLNIKVNELFKE
ncbi:probable 28S ribosomal protein S23, mitochondrial [Agrilus planipennis]|uniref:Small ribosomal subunit protein mS23 n=1 Tax=Agrilus planipennis TaxID=224129 RepID=A0A1W4WX76_AGRPL|nr:probable 28S ribosomal protein S23, mitochondrial [Agrilus planipennis]